MQEQHQRVWMARMFPCSEVVFYQALYDADVWVLLMEVRCERLHGVLVHDT